MKQKQKIFIYYHIDFDGLVSAFLLKRYLKKKGYDPEYGEALDYNKNTREDWYKFKFKKPFAIVDFKYHRDAKFFIDHHGNHEPDGCRSDAQMCVYDPKADSAAELIYDMAKKEKINLGNVKRLVKYASMIDTASFKDYGISAEALVLAENNIAKIVRVIEKNHGLVPRILNDLEVRGFIQYVVNEMFGRWLKKIVNKAYVINKIKKIQEESQSAVKMFMQKSHYRNGLVQYDMTQMIFNRYLPAVVYPQSFLWFGICYYDNKYSVKLNVNPWASEEDKKFVNNYDLGRIAEKHGGGGHPAVGTIYVYSLEEAKKLYQKILPEIEKIVN